MNPVYLNKVPEQAIRFLLKEWLLTTAAAGLFFTSLHLKRLPLYSRHDFEVLFILFTLFVVINGLEKSGLFATLAAKLSNGRYPAVRLIIGIFFLSMFVTNDVALLVGVPLALRLNCRRPHLLVIFLALSANSGSALTPFGNPQNLFIYWFYHLHPWQFVEAIAPFSLVTGFLIAVVGFSLFPATSARQKIPRFYRSAWLYLAALIMIILTILKISPLWTGVFLLAVMVFYDRKAFHVDYVLLLTFACFFGFTDNLVAMLEFRLTNPDTVFLASAISSQFISNVPAALLYSDFTVHWHALLWGVSVGGFGNLVGSLANLIAYRLYIKENSCQKKFLLSFHLWGYLFFAIGIALFYMVSPHQ